jgi:hypothetical protein
MPKRCSVETWDGKPLQAASIGVGTCIESRNLVGIDLVAQDGKTFAHGHFDIETAVRFRADLDLAIEDARKQLN